MSDEILRTYIIKHIEVSTEQVINFSWHGGEPMLAGLNFFRQAVRLQKKYLPVGRTLVNGIQTNGTLIDENWSRFFADENFMVGLSMDGPEDLHNQFRRTSSGDPSWPEVMNGYRLLQKHKVPTEILCVLNSCNSLHPVNIYNFFKDLEVRYLTFLPLVIKLPGSLSEAGPESVRPEEFGHFLCKVFDLWVENDIGKIKIQIFEEALSTVFRQDHTLCIFKRECSGVPVVEHNGDFYSCDHYVDNKHRIGNINEKSLDQLLDNPEQVKFGKSKSISLPLYCRHCDFIEMCNGECPKNRFILTPEGEPGLNYLCPGYKIFFSHLSPMMEVLRLARNDENNEPCL